MRRIKIGYDGYIDPGSIMGVVVAMVILMVGIFAFTTVLSNLPTTSDTSTESTETSPSNSTTPKDTEYIMKDVLGAYDSMGSILNIFPIVMTVAIAMLILGFVCRCVDGGYDDYESKPKKTPKPIPKPQVILPSEPKPIMKPEQSTFPISTQSKDNQLFKKRPERIGNEIKK